MPGACAATPQRNRKHPAHGLLSLSSLLRAFLLTAIKRNKAPSIVGASFGKSHSRTPRVPVPDRPRAKGAVDCPPCGKTAIFRRVGMSEQWRLAVSVGGFWLCSGRLNKTKTKSGASGLAFLSMTSHITPDCRKCPLLGCSSNKGRRGFVLYVKQGPQIHSPFCCCTPTSPRTAALKFDHCFSSGSVASPLALVAARRRPFVFDRRSFSGAPRLAAVRLADWRVQICSHVPASATNTCLKPHFNAPPPPSVRGLNVPLRWLAACVALSLTSIRPTFGSACVQVVGLDCCSSSPT